MLDRANACPKKAELALDFKGKSLKGFASGNLGQISLLGIKIKEKVIEDCKV